LPLEVVLNVVNDDGLFEISSKHAEVFEVHSAVVVCMLSVESVRDVFIVRVKDIKNPVSIVLAGCCEDHYLKDLRHVLKECDAIRSNLKLSLFGFEMN
jgi:hypothetical protein